MNRRKALKTMLATAVAPFIPAPAKAAPKVVNALEWVSEGGIQLNFKVMCIMVPKLNARVVTFQDLKTKSL